MSNIWNLATGAKASMSIFKEMEQKGFLDLPSTVQGRYGGVYNILGKSSMAPEVVTSLINARMEGDKDNWGNFSYGLLLKLKNPNDKEKVIAKMEHLMYENRVVKNAKHEGITIEEYEKKNGKDSLKIIFTSLKLLISVLFIDKMRFGNP